MSKRNTIVAAIGGLLWMLSIGCGQGAVPSGKSAATAANATSSVPAQQAANLGVTPTEAPVASSDINSQQTPDETKKTERPDEQPDAGVAADSESLQMAVDKARRTGWVLAQSLLGAIRGREDFASFPGIQAFLDDVDSAATKTDSSKVPAEWSLDADKLVTHNPNFWRATYEIAPSDPGWLLIHANLLLAAGEAKRSLLVLQVGKWTPGIPKEMLDALFSVQVTEHDALQSADRWVEKGIKLYDAGDIDGARKVYEEVLQVWPQCSAAHYELGLTVRSQLVRAAGIKDKLEEIELKESYPGTKESAPHFARARLHDPLQWKAYQGDDQEVIQQFMALGERQKAIEKVNQTLGSGRSDDMPDSVLLEFADACQGAGQDELALVTRQVIVARRGRFDPSDHPFLSKSLRALAPSPQIEEVIEKLAGATIKLAQLVPREPEPQPETKGPDPSGFDVKSIILYQVEEILSERIGQDVTPITDYINSLKAAAQEYWKTRTKDDGRKMMLILYLKPDRKAKFWMTIHGKAIPQNTQTELQERIEKLPPPEVKGPVVMGLLVDLWGGKAIEVTAKPPGLPDGLLFPKDWQEAAISRQLELQLPISDEVLKVVWPD